MTSGNELALLKEKIKERFSEKRYIHSLGVEKCAIALSRLCGVGSQNEISYAALLHDVTKELDKNVQISLLKKAKASLTDTEWESEAVFHSYTAPLIIKSDFPDFATENVLSAVENHTVGSENMSPFDEIIFLSDYIEEGRTYQSSRELYDFVFSNMKDGDFEKNALILHKACLMAIDYTIAHLIKKGVKIVEKTFLTRNALISKILHS
jgi:nicotinate-nucleotide adenylyltransferase